MSANSRRGRWMRVNARERVYETRNKDMQTAYCNKPRAVRHPKLKVLSADEVIKRLKHDRGISTADFPDELPTGTDEPTHPQPRT